MVYYPPNFALLVHRELLASFRSEIQCWSHFELRILPVEFCEASLLDSKIVAIIEFIIAFINSPAKIQLP